MRVGAEKGPDDWNGGSHTQVPGKKSELQITANGSIILS